MKRIYTCLVVLFAALTLAACGTDGAANVSNGNDCPSGEELNEITGQCDPIDEVDGGGNNGGGNNGGSDAGNLDGGGGGEDSGPANPFADGDQDGIVDRRDNCDAIANPDQSDLDKDGIGDPCDNCPEAANFDQTDSNSDGQGDACTGSSGYDAAKDHDGDGEATVNDNCPETANPDQTDTDGDKLGDACDNCPEDKNYDQADSNNDGQGDACTPTPVGDICATQESSFTQVEPNIYIVLDKSGSMGGDSMTEAKSALRTIADNLAGSVRFGVLTYPNGGNECNSPGQEILDMGSHPAQDIKDAVNAVNTGGRTPTGGALKQVRTQGLAGDPSDSLDSARPKVAVLITDGNPNDDCGEQSYAANQATQLANAGIPLYVIGFNSGASPSNLDELARNGGTGSHYTADSPNQLVNVLSGISDSVISCSYVLDPPPEDSAKIWVEIQGSPVSKDATNGFSYDDSSDTLTLHGAACTTLRNVDPNAPQPLEITLGCATDCEVSGEEICDYIDNDCDGDIDEGCENCAPEICDDGIDNNCNGEEDDGCRDCQLEDQTCSGDADCCEGSCVEGVCQPECLPVNVTCRENSDCCTGVCAKQGETGTCIGG